MAAITDLGAASSVAAGDELAISQSGTDRRVTADKFAIVGVANTFGGNVRVPRLEVDGANAYIDTDSSATIPVLYLRGAPVAVANDSPVSLPPVGLLFIAVEALASYALMVTRGAYNATMEIFDSAGIFTTTKDTANSINVYYDAAAGGYRLQNRCGSTLSIQIVRIGG